MIQCHRTYCKSRGFLLLPKLLIFSCQQLTALAVIAARPRHWHAPAACAPLRARAGSALASRCPVPLLRLKHACFNFPPSPPALTSGRTHAAAPPAMCAGSPGARGEAPGAPRGWGGPRRRRRCALPTRKARSRPAERAAAPCGFTRKRSGKSRSKK